MEYSRTFPTEAEFNAAWPHVVKAMVALHEQHLILPDYRWELAEPDLVRARPEASVDIEKALRKLWDLDDRFFGQVVGGDASAFRWSVYSLAYLSKDEATAQNLMAIYAPLLGRFAFREFGVVFCRKVCATFHDDVSELLWEVQKAEPPHEMEFFDWQGQRNSWPEARREALLAIAGLPLLKDPDIPPPDVMRVFCPAVHHARVGPNYRRDLRRFYAGRGV